MGLSAVLLAVALGYVLGRGDRATLRAAQDGERSTDGSPLRIAPSSQNPRKTPLRSGEALLLEILQALSDASAQATLVLGEIDLDQKIVLEKAYPDLDLAEARRLLASAGLQLSEELYRDEKVHWVQPKLERTRRRGGLVRRDGDPDDRDTEDPGRGRDASRSLHEPPRGPGRARSSAPGGSSLDAERRAELDAIESDALRLYERRVGGETRYLVQFETRSYDEAFEAMSLIDAVQRTDATPRAVRRSEASPPPPPSNGVPPIKRR